MLFLFYVDGGKDHYGGIGGQLNEEMGVWRTGRREKRKHNCKDGTTCCKSSHLICIPFLTQPFPVSQGGVLHTVSPSLPFFFFFFAENQSPKPSSFVIPPNKNSTEFSAYNFDTVLI